MTTPLAPATAPTTTPPTATTTPATPPATTPPADPPTTTPPEGRQPFAVFESSEALNDRLERAAVSRLKKELGLGSFEEAKAYFARMKELEESEKKRKEADMSEVERERAARAAAEAETATLRERATRAERNAEQARIFAAHGVKDHAYASFVLLEAESEAKAKGEVFDPVAKIAELAADPRGRVKLGIDDVAAPTTTPTTTVPATTTRGGGPTPPAPGAGAPVKTAFDMDAQEWARKKATLGLG